MESCDLIKIFREEVVRVETQGTTQIQVQALKGYLDALEKSATDSLEYRKQQHEGVLAHYAAEAQHNIEMLKSVLEAGKSALQALLFINGGAVVAMLGVMSNLAGKPEGTQFARYLALPLLEFGFGVLCGAVGFALRYFSQACYASGVEEKPQYEKWGDRLRYAAIAVGLLGYAAFAVAMVNAYHAVTWSFVP